MWQRLPSKRTNMTLFLLRVHHEFITHWKDLSCQTPCLASCLSAKFRRTPPRFLIIITSGSTRPHEKLSIGHANSAPGDFQSTPLPILVRPLPCLWQLLGNNIGHRELQLFIMMNRHTSTGNTCFGRSKSHNFFMDIIVMKSATVKRMHVADMNSPGLSVPSRESA